MRKQQSKLTEYGIWPEIVTNKCGYKCVDRWQGINAHELITSVNMPARGSVRQRRFLRDIKLPTAGCPSFCTLLKLKQHIFTVIVVIEEVHVIKHKDKRFSRFFGTSQSHLFELVHD